eukprot:90930_1
MSELRLRSCNITTRGIIYLFDAYLIRQQRVIEQHTNLLHNILNNCNNSFPFPLCSIIIEFIADWQLDTRLAIHFDLSRCSLINMNGFNHIIDKYIIQKKIIVKYIDMRCTNTQNTHINVINIYKLFHYLKYNQCIGRLIFCVSLKNFNITNKIMQLLTVNITEMDIDMAINDISIAHIFKNKEMNNININKTITSPEGDDLNNLNIINDLINKY